MDFQTILASTGISILLLMPLAVKWQIRLKRGLAGAIAIGITAGALTGIISSFYGNLSMMAQTSLDASLILGLAIGSVAYMFYRDPERSAPEQPGVIVSPADGEVIYIKEIKRGEVPLTVKKGRQFKLEELTQTDLIKDGGFLIGIGMNLLNVHVNRSPIRGKVELIEHTRGDFLSLKRPEAVLKNERLTTVIDGGSFRVGVVQIASRLVRRIETYLHEDQIIDKGQRIGMIKFGSQVDLIVPRLEKVSIKVQPGDEVKAGVSVLVEYESKSKESLEHMSSL